MKKYLFTLLTIVMCLALVFAMTACTGEKTVEPVSDTDAGGEILTDPIVKYGEGLPSWQLKGEYIMGEIPEEYSTTMTELYLPVDENNVALAIYHFAKDGMTLQEVLDADIAKYVSEDQHVTGAIFDSMFEAGDYDYAYYMYYNTEDFTSPRYMQEYIFDGEEEYAQVEFMLPVQNVEVEGTDIVVPLPAEMSEYEISEASIALDGIWGYEDVEGEYPNIEAYVWETEATNGEELLAELNNAEGFEMEEIRHEVSDFTAADGNTYPGLYVEFTETMYGVEYWEASSCLIMDGKAVCINFSVPADSAALDYVKVAVGPIEYAYDTVTK